MFNTFGSGQDLPSSNERSLLAAIGKVVSSPSIEEDGGEKEEDDDEEL